MTKNLSKTFPVAVVTETGKPDSVTGKFETLGSNFSNETRNSEAACAVATFEKFSLGFLYTKKHETIRNDCSMLSLFFRLSFH